MEFAIVSTVLFALFFGLVGISLVEIGNSVGTNSAREGARQATISFRCADAQSPGGTPVSGCTSTAGPSDAYSTIVSTVKAKLVGLVRGAPVVTVQCLNGSVATPSPKSCDASIVPQTDLVKVTVQWSHLGVTPFVPGSSHSSSATMVIVGSGSVGPVAPSCQVTSSSFGTGTNPQVVTILGIGTSGTLTQSVVVAANTTSTCTSLYLTYRNSTGTSSSVPVSMSGSEPSFTLTLPASIVWTVDTYAMVFTDASASAVASVAPALTLVVQSAAACSISSTLSVPAAVTLANGATTQGSLASGLVITAATTASCGTVSVSFNTGTTFVTNLPMSGVLGGVSLNVLAGAYVWTTGLKLITFSTATNSSLGSTTLSVSPGCALRFEVDGTLGLAIAGMKMDSQNHLSGPVTLKATPASGCAGALVFSFSTGTTSVVSGAVSQVVGVYSLAVSATAYTWRIGTVSFSFTYASTPIAPNPSQNLVICKHNANSCP